MKEKEIIDVVDENGDFTGVTMDKDEVHSKNLFHNEVGCFIINDKKQTLMQKRSFNKRIDPNMWAICAGHVEAGENLEDAMERELEEELGIKVNKSEFIPLPGFEKIVSRRKDINSHISYTYYLKSNLSETDFVIQEEELSEVKWVDIDEVINMINSDDNSTVFKKYEIEVFEALKNLKEKVE